MLIELLKDFTQLVTGNSNAEKYTDLPHFEKALNKGKVMKIIQNARFLPYTTKNGVVLNNIAVSDDDKWIYLLDGYLPVDLICGYNRKENVLYAIDGAMIKLPLKARTHGISNDIEAFFEDRGIFYTDKPRKAAKKFDESFDRPCDQLDKADFSRLRYMWEKASVSDKNGFWDNHGRNRKYNPVQNGMVNTTIFERVLTDAEIAKTADAVRKKKVKLSQFLSFDEYSNEFSVCNGVELLDCLRYPDNMDGVDFLFRCLGDVDEAYFRSAVLLLKSYPRKMVCKRIEENVKLALENNDPVGLAGLMYFAQDINYEIKCVQDMETDMNSKLT
jgi:hypothetical protein